LKKLNIKFYKSKVGDRNVISRQIKTKSKIGFETSGHISFNNIMDELSTSKILPNESNNLFLNKIGTSSLKKPTSYKEILRRPEVFYDTIIELDSKFNKIEDKIVQSLIENEIKYEGYISRQNASVQQIEKLQEIKIPTGLNINAIPGLSNELKQKLKKIQPETIGQASRISGITPAALNILMIYIKKDSSEATARSI